jgi:hypothetical protein
VSCAEGDAALSSTLWSGGRTRAWTTHLAACTTCRAALAARDTDQGAGALGALVDRWRPITPTYHAVVAGEHLAACIACLMVAELDEVLPR